MIFHIKSFTIYWTWKCRTV